MSTSRAAVSQRFLDDLYGRIAPRYDLVNWIQSLGLVGAVRRAAARRIARGVVLDAGAGSGELAAACLAAGAAAVVCLDRSPEMFAVARAKLAAPESEGRVRFVLGDVARLPFRDRAFDNAGSAFVFRNIPDVGAALAEMRRVLRPGGRLAIADVLAPPGGLFGALYRVYLNVMVPVWGWLFARDQAAYRYLSSSIQRCFSGAELAVWVADAGFAEARVQNKFGGVTQIVGGRRP
jgi:demethylmenaquinone methyltransferase/2-methoxy-6-polyprenyl-1,4-benzoquinol methylase